MMQLKESDIVMCTVKRIEGTTVFLDIEENGQGTMNLSEVAAGRIRNLREYVAPNKKIVCKVLKIYPDHAELSLRRVTGKEREEILERYKKERTFFSMLKATVKNPQELIDKIKAKNELWEFYDKLKENPSLISEFASQADAEKLLAILAEKRDKPKEIKKVFSLQSQADSGIKDIRDILSVPEIEIKYLGSSKFSISASAKDFKEANAKVQNALHIIGNKAKEKKALFEFKEA